MFATIGGFRRGVFTEVWLRNSIFPWGSPPETCLSEIIAKKREKRVKIRTRFFGEDKKDGACVKESENFSGENRLKLSLKSPNSVTACRTSAYIAVSSPGSEAA